MSCLAGKKKSKQHLSRGHREKYDTAAFNQSLFGSTAEVQGNMRGIAVAV